jgi:hypothetical protein
MVDLPEPDTPVKTTSLSFGIDSETFLRLCSRAPRMDIEAMPETPSKDGLQIRPDYTSRGKKPPSTAIAWRLVCGIAARHGQSV